MKELLISQIAPIAATAVVGILVVIIKTIGSAAVEVLGKKKEQIEQAIKTSGHEADLATAKEAWNIIEEKFRITENAKEILGSKADEFNKLLLQRIPGLTQQNIDDLRQAIAGEVNSYKTILTGEAISTGADKINIQSDSNQTISDSNSIQVNLNLDTSASSKITVDNPENIQAIGAMITATSAATPQ